MNVTVKLIICHPWLLLVKWVRFVKFEVVLFNRKSCAETLKTIIMLKALTSARISNTLLVTAVMKNIMSPIL